MPKDNSQSTREAVLYRMVMDDHLCPYGLKSKDLLEREGYEVEDHHLTSRAETDAFLEEHGVETTPQTFMDGERIGGYEALRKHFRQDVLFIGTIGAVSVFKAVYIDKRELKCACVGGASNVPLGFVSLTENLMMIFMGLWMPARAFGWF